MRDFYVRVASSPASLPSCGTKVQPSHTCCKSSQSSPSCGRLPPLYQAPVHRQRRPGSPPRRCRRRRCSPPRSSSRRGTSAPLSSGRTTQRTSCCTRRRLAPTPARPLLPDDCTQSWCDMGRNTASRTRSRSPGNPTCRSCACSPRSSQCGSRNEDCQAKERIYVL